MALKNLIGKSSLRPEILFTDDYLKELSQIFCSMTFFSAPSSVIFAIIISQFYYFSKF